MAAVSDRPSVPVDDSEPVAVGVGDVDEDARNAGSAARAPARPFAVSSVCGAASSQRSVMSAELPIRSRSTMRQAAPDE
jgi:hypothetical protein